MRVTGNRLVELATNAVRTSQDALAEATGPLSTGIAVERPSQDPVAWAEGRRAAVRKVASEGRGEAIGRSRERLDEADRAMGSLNDIMTRAREIAVQGANDSYSAADRADMASEIQGLLAEGVAHANTRGSDGSYLFAGSLSGAAPFDASGAYLGDNASTSVELAEGMTGAITVPGAGLTAARGIDVLPTLGALATALANNDVPGIRTAVDALEKANRQVSSMRSDAGHLATTLRDVDDARGKFETNLSGMIASAIEADPIKAASELARRASALEAARAVASKVITMTTPGG